MNIKNSLKFTFLFASILAFLLLNFKNSAQGENLDEVCQLEKIEEECQVLSPVECRELLEKCGEYYEEKSAQIEKDLTKTEQEKKTLQDKIYSLRKKIENLTYQIYQGNLVIKDLGLQVKDTEASIEKTSLKIIDFRGQLANILQLIYEEDQRSIIEILLLEEELSDFFNDLAALETLNSKNREVLETIKTLKSSLESEKELLSEEKQDMERTVKVQTLQKQESAETKEEQEYFLKLTEAEYQQYLKAKEETEKKAAEIRARIYELIGVREVITYEEALDVAKYAASQIGIRPALLLGVLSQESKIGKNVGQCFLKNPKTGEGIRVATGEKITRVMNPSRDVPYFLAIIEKLNNTKGLALDPYQTLVSCPMSFGWGGAMGPAQFIPDTWANPRYGYERRVEEITGSAADPWDIRDASLAASIYLKDGLDKYGTEGKAVQSYFCGYPKNDYWCSWYEKNVLYLAQCHQTFIDKGSMSLDCQEAIGLK
jgi:membrane-bound lytic murein transglycosylase B